MTSEELTTITIITTTMNTLAVPTAIRVREILIISPMPAITRNQGQVVDEPIRSVVVRAISTVPEWLLENKMVMTITTIITTALRLYRLRTTITHRYPHPYSRWQAGPRFRCRRHRYRQLGRDTNPRLIARMAQDREQSPDWCQRRSVKSTDLRSTGMPVSTAVSMMVNIENHTIISHDIITKRNVKLQIPKPTWNNTNLVDGITATLIIMIVSRNAIMTIMITMTIETKNTSDDHHSAHHRLPRSVLG